MATLREQVTLDGNEAAAYVAHKINEVCAIYPITPSSNMGEWVDEYTALGQENIWGNVPTVIEMQSEGGAAGAVHGALQTGALTTTFTASQGLLLMIPNMYKIAGELTSTVFHVSARTLATHALSIFGDHSDVMAVRQTGWTLISSANVQEIMDFTLITQAVTLESRVPIVHFFDGFRSSHEISKVELLTHDDMRIMIEDDLVQAHRKRGLSPDRPLLRGTAQNPDVFFQGREACNTFYEAIPGILQKQLDKFSKLTGRNYHLYEYYGDPQAESLIILMGSSAETVKETIDYLNARGAKYGMLQVRLFRPFSIEHFIKAIPTSIKMITALDRTKEPGSLGEPLYMDVITALVESGKSIPVLGGRYGLSSKEFTPAMVKAVFDNMTQSKPQNHFTVGILDDVTFKSLKFDSNFTTEGSDVHRAIFWGLGSDGTVGANKNTIKIIGEETDLSIQGYFVYDSKKSGSITASHLRFGKKPIRSTYLVNRANFIGCHQFVFLQKYPILTAAENGSTFLLNAPYQANEVWKHLPLEIQETIIDRKIKFYTIDAYKVARESNLGGRINTIMQTCFFAISGVLPKDEAIAKIKESIQKSYSKKGEKMVELNHRAVDITLQNLHLVSVPSKVTASIRKPPIVSEQAPAFVQSVLAPILAYQGDSLPVSALPAGGTFPTGTAKWEKRNIAQEIPEWNPEVCIQCGKCSINCPHASIRINVYPKSALGQPPQTFKSIQATGKEYQDHYFTIQVAPEDCTGCGLCVTACPAKDKKEPRKKAINMVPQAPLREQEVKNWEYFNQIPTLPRTDLKLNSVKGSQLSKPLFEFSGACAGCGETPYLSLLTQLFGDRALIANATGCSSIYGGSLPTVPYTTDENGRGPAWSNSLFEDNAEFGLGFRLTIDHHRQFALKLVDELRLYLGDSLAQDILQADMTSEAGISAQRVRVAEVKEKLKFSHDPKARDLYSLADLLVKKSVWIVGGDGWAYDIGFGGLDHVIASGRDVNILVLDTGVYSNTGGQCSKSTPLGAVAKFAFAGKSAPRKDLALMAMSYENAYVAQVAMGSSDAQVIKAFTEAESFPGPSIILAYSHCIAHGINMSKGTENQKAAVQSGFWPTFRYNPLLMKEGKNPFQLDCSDPKIGLRDWAYQETRFKMLTKSMPQVAEELIRNAQKQVNSRWNHYSQLAGMTSTSTANQNNSTLVP